MYFNTNNFIKNKNRKSILESKVFSKRTCQTHPKLVLNVKNAFKENKYGAITDLWQISEKKINNMKRETEKKKDKYDKREEKTKAVVVDS